MSTTNKLCPVCNLREICVTVYNKEFEPIKYYCDICDLEERLKDYKETQIITQSLVTTAQLERVAREYGYNGIREDYKHVYQKNWKTFRELLISVEKLYLYQNQIQEKYWTPWLYDYWMQAKVKGHSCSTDSFKVLLWGCAGRVLVTLENTEAQVTLYFQEAPTFIPSFRSLTGTFEQLDNLLKDGAANFPKLVPDTDVCYL